MRLSIIIPAFKVQDHIEKCIRSLENQDIPNSEYEIIVTNDGSPDRVKEIVAQLQTEFPNIVLINQENQGVSMARNNALAVAKGNYILPIDPDDYCVPNALERILKTVETEDLDVLYLGFEIFDGKQTSVWKTNYKQQQTATHTGVEGYFASRGNNVRDPDRSWAMLYKRAMLVKYQIAYPKDVPFLEDGLFLAKVFAVAEKVGFDDAIFYQRTIRPGSATNSRLFYSEKAIDGFIFAIQNLKAFAAKNQLHKNQKLLVNHVVAKFILLPLTASIGQKKMAHYIQLLKKFKENEISKIELEGLRLDYPKLAKMYNFSPYFFYVYFPIITKLKLYKK